MITKLMFHQCKTQADLKNLVWFESLNEIQKKIVLCENKTEKAKLQKIEADRIMLNAKGIDSNNNEIDGRAIGSRIPNGIDSSLDCSNILYAEQSKNVEWNGMARIQIITPKKQWYRTVNGQVVRSKITMTSDEKQQKKRKFSLIPYPTPTPTNEIRKQVEAIEKRGRKSPSKQGSKVESSPAKARFVEGGKKSLSKSFSINKINSNLESQGLSNRDGVDFNE